MGHSNNVVEVYMCEQIVEAHLLGGWVFCASHVCSGTPDPRAVLAKIQTISAAEFPARYDEREQNIIQDGQ